MGRRGIKIDTTYGLDNYYKRTAGGARPDGGPAGDYDHKGAQDGAPDRKPKEHCCQLQAAG